MDLDMENKKIKKIACTSKIAHFLTFGGDLFSYGFDQQRTGILGQGTKYLFVSPTMH